MKALRWPWLWLGIWAGLLVAVVVASLGAPPPGPDIPASDKWMHLTTYAGLAVVAVQLFRRGRPVATAAGLVVLMGVGLEIAQGTLTTDRTMDWRDAVANTTGVGLGLATLLLPGRDLLLGLVGRAAR